MRNYSSLSEITTDINAGKLTCAALVDYYLNNIEEQKDLNAFLEVFTDEVKERALAIDEKIKNGTAGKLAGMVIGIKDNLCYKGHKVSASSKILEGFESLYTATALERLLAEDAIFIGRLNCDEFAMGSSNFNSAYGKVLNPIDKTKTSGGSSGGASAAVAADMCLATLGSDTGGSIRQPAAFTGIVGYKPTYGTISRYGLIAFASSFDQIGPLTRSVEDAALLTEIMGGVDEYDSTMMQKEAPAFSEAKYDGKPKRIAYLKDCLEHSAIDPEIRKQTEDIIEGLRKDGHTVEAIDFPYIDYMVPIYYVLTPAEASSNLARYDGVHYGYRSPNAVDLESTYKKSRTEGFGEEVKRRIILGTFVLSSGYYDAYYGKAQKARRFVKDKTQEIFNDYDFILSPTTPHTAFSLDRKDADPTVMYLEDIFTAQANITGMPAISLPIGTHSNGLPIGIHLMANNFADEQLLAFSQYVMNTYK